jgi:hypothetical protein
VLINRQPVAHSPPTALCIHSVYNDDCLAQYIKARARESPGMTLLVDRSVTSCVRLIWGGCEINRCTGGVALVTQLGEFFFQCREVHMCLQHLEQWLHVFPVHVLH